jgi:hypothetical protein
MAIVKIVPMPGPGGDGNPVNTGNFVFDENEVSTNEDMTIGVNGVPGTINLSAFAGVNLQFADAQDAGLKFPDGSIQTTAYEENNSDIADFVFDYDPDDEESTITINNHDMTIRTTRDDGQDADIMLDSADDIWINANDQIEITSTTDNISIFTGLNGINTWQFNADGSFRLPSGETSIISGVDGNYVVNSLTIIANADYLNSENGPSASGVYLTISPDTGWFASNFGNGGATITFADNTTVQTTSTYDATLQGVPAMAFSWLDTGISKTFAEAFPMTITGNVTMPKEFIALIAGNAGWGLSMDGSITFPQQDSNDRTGVGEVLKFGNSTQQSIITGPTPTSTNPTAQRLVVAGQDGYTGTNGEGGDVYLWAGKGGSANGSGGDIKLDGGQGNGELGAGGTVKMRGGSSNAAGNGGFVEISAGYSYEGTGGSVSINAGNNAIDTESYGGSVNINAGYSGNAMGGGNISLTTSQAGKIILNGAGGEFLNDSSNPNNQIATLGDVSGGVNLTVPVTIDDSNGDDFITFTRTSTGTARIGTPQDDLSLRSARDITLYAGDNGPGNVYIGWGDATYTPDSTNRVATIGDINSAPKTYTANNDATYGTYQANGFTEVTSNASSTTTDEVGSAADYFNTGQIEVFISLNNTTDALLTSIQNGSVYVRKITITNNLTDYFLTNPVRLSDDGTNARWRFDCSPELSIANNTGYGLSIEHGGSPIVWWDSETLGLSSSSDFRGAKIDYHAYIDDAGTVIGTIYLASDSGDMNVTHIETSSGGSDTGTAVFWRRGTIWSDEGKLFLYRTDGESQLHKIQWTAQVYYATEYYGD